MAEGANVASHVQVLDKISSEPPPAISKRKADADAEPLNENQINEDKKAKLQSPEASDKGAGDPIATGNGHEKTEIPSVVDKGKGIVVVEDKVGSEDDEAVGDDSDSDEESTDSDDDNGIWACLDDDTDFDEDPLAEVDLDNILPSRTRRREPPPPGAYLVNDVDDEDSGESE